MRNRGFTYLLITFLLSFLAMASSCQKDPALKDANATGNNLNPDSVIVGAFVSSPGNFLAAAGFLKIKIQDSTYTFDAARDSIAFVNVRVDDHNRYFGITAINKEHTLSFGISSSGFVNSNITSAIAGGQLLLNPDSAKPGIEYSLSKYAGQSDFGSINIAQYNQGNKLAKGTFFTFLAKNDKADSPVYKVQGSFDLQLK